MNLLTTTLAVMAALFPLAVALMIKLDILYALVGLIITMIISYNILRHWIDQYRIEDIRNKYVLVTGCDTGFGRSLVERLSRKGVKVIAGCLKGESVTQLQELGNDNMIPLQMDVSNTESIQNAYQTLTQAHPEVQRGLWGIVNNAGILGPLVPSEWLNHEDYLKVFNVNTFGPIMVNKTFLTLVKRAKGRIVNTASYLSRVSPPNSTQYCMSKYALRSYTDSLRREMYPFNVTVHTIEPGGFRTGLANIPLIVDECKRIYTTIDPEVQEQYGQEYVENFTKVTALSFDWVLSSHTETVVDAYEHALFGTYPRTRYRIGLDSKIFSFLSVLPDWLVDVMFNLTGQKPNGCKPFTS